MGVARVALDSASRRRPSRALRYGRRFWTNSPRAALRLPASPADYLRLPLEMLKVGAVGTWHALGLAKDMGARFVLASTSEVYGDPQVHPQPEGY